MTDPLGGDFFNRLESDLSDFTVDDKGYERLDGPIMPHFFGSAYCEKFHCNKPENDPIHDYEDPEEFGF